MCNLIKKNIYIAAFFFDPPLAPFGAVNMHVWWSKQEEYADEIDAIEEAVSEAAAAKTSKSGGDDAAGVQAAADASVEGVGAAAAAGDEGKGERESKPMTAEERMEKAKKEVSTAFSKEKKARYKIQGIVRILIILIIQYAKRDVTKAPSRCLCDRTTCPVRIIPSYYIKTVQLHKQTKIYKRNIS